MKLAELLVIISLFIIFFGARKIPQLISSLKASGKSFKRGLNEDDAPTVRDVHEIEKKD